jgi:hypothetical protein
MKKISLLLFTLVLLVLASNILVYSQNNTTAKQVIIANGGKFESVPPYSDYVTIESYNLSTLAVTVFNTIYTQSVQDVLINNNHAYVTAQDSVVMYNLDNYQRLAAVRDSGVNRMALFNDKLIVTKQYPIGRFRVEVLNASDLGLIAFVDGIPGDCEGVAVYGNHAYVAVDSGYAGVEGRLAIINTSNWTLNTIVNFGTSAIGIYNVYSYGGYIYCIDKTPYGGGNVGSITQFDPATGNFVTNTMAVKIGAGIGIGGNLLYLGINGGIGSYNLDTQTIADTSIFNYFGGIPNLEIYSAALDYINNKFYTNWGNRSSYGVGIVFSLAGDSLTSYATGLNADACAIDFRSPTGIANQRSVQDAISIYPNPVNDFIGINLNSTATLKEIKILDLTGRTIDTKSVQKGENNIRISVSDYPSGVYLISITTDQGTKVRKFIKR